MSNQQPIKFKMNSQQRSIFDQLNTAQQIRLLQTLEAKQAKTIKPAKPIRHTKAYQDDSQEIINQYQDHLI